jgi:hypothetical protein
VSATILDFRDPAIFQLDPKRPTRLELVNKAFGFTADSRVRFSQFLEHLAQAGADRDAGCAIVGEFR